MSEELDKMRKCRTCKVEKLESEFSATELKRKSTQCKECTAAYNKAYHAKNKDVAKGKKKQFYDTNRDRLIEEGRKNYYFHQEKRLEAKKAYYKANKNSLLEKNKQWRIDNRDKALAYVSAYQKDRTKNDPNYRLRQSVSSSIYYYLKSRDFSKDGKSCMDFLDYSIDELRLHIEKQFEPWMTWDNQGKYNTDTWDDNDPTTWTWQIDHIIPASKFNYTSMNDQGFRDCWSLSNLRPYSAKQNVLDGNRREAA